LFSGGKDSTLAVHHASKRGEVGCLISVISKNPESYMFHTPNIQLVDKLAVGLGLPLVKGTTKGEKEKELADLERVMSEAKKRYRLNGIATGALASVYQASRIKRLCDKLGLECYNPLWQKDQLEVLRELVQLRFKTIIVGVFGEGLDGFLGREIDARFILDVQRAAERFRISPAGEGGEFESLVLDGPIFKRRLVIKRMHIEVEGEFSKRIVVDEAVLEP